jgi:hypothetical protein
MATLFFCIIRSTIPEARAAPTSLFAVVWRSTAIKLLAIAIGRGIEQLPAWLAWGVPLLHKPTTKGTSQHPCTYAEAKIGKTQ